MLKIRQIRHLSLIRPITFIFSVLMFFVVFPKNIKAQQGPSFNCNAGFETVANGIEYKQFTASSPRKLTFFVVKVDLTNPDIDFVVTPRTNLGTTTSTFLGSFAADVAINGDLHLGLTNPLGLAAAAGDVYSDRSPEPSFFASEDNIITFFNKGPGALWDAISGSTTLVTGGSVNDKLFTCAKAEYCSALAGRTSVGKTGNDKLIIIVVDGRQPGYSVGVPLIELAHMHVNCNSRQAINMDGGGSTTLVFSDLGVVNRPSDGRERTVSNHFGICSGGCNQVLDPSRNCFIADVRHNPGDSLFAGEMTADLNYTVNFYCTFLKPGGGRLCNYIGGECQNTSGQVCDDYYGRVDCFDDIYGSVEGDRCANGCRSLPGCSGGRCYPPDFENCTGVRDPYQCPVGYICASSCDQPVDDPWPIEQVCTVNPYVTINTIVKTPLAEKIWKRLVAGPSGVFKRFVPKIDPDSGSPIAYLNKIFGGSPVEYKSLDGSTIVAGNPEAGRPGSEAEMYFPYIGGVHQYFLQCIQTLLRPRGYGANCPKGTEPVLSPTPIPGGGNCAESNSQYCSVAYLQKTFGDKASIASQICAIESGGNPLALNSGCLTGRSYDYSVGLFQVNLVPIPQYDGSGNIIGLVDSTWRCPGAFVTDINRVLPPFCIIKDNAILEACVQKFSDPDYNISVAWGPHLSNGGTYWCDWKYAALKCGIQDCP